VEAFFFSSDANIGDSNETLESIKNEEETSVSFSAYEHGIMKQDLVKEPKIAIAQKEEDEILHVPSEGSILVQLDESQVNNHLVQVDAKQVINQDQGHAVIIVGWGHDNKTNMNYWVLRNSYGDHWGMTGDFMVRRGMNDFAVESEGMGFDIELY
jgi:hypothetical protein